MPIMGTVVGVQKELNVIVRWLSIFSNIGGGELIIYLEGCLVPDPSVSSLYVVPGFPSMLFAYLYSTSSHLPLLFLRIHSVG
jgi:hypothetical protein